MKTLFERYWDVLGFALLAGFVPWTELDLAASGWFYRPDDGFFLSREPWVQAVHHSIPILASGVAAALLATIALGYLPGLAALEKYRRPALFLLLSLALGPGLLVNGVFKSHSGRARPADVVQFGGDKTFTQPLVIADQCGRNCSFVCGHASMGFVLCAFGFLTRRRAWHGAAIAAGLLLGLARVAHGKHFLSDVVFSFFAVYFCTQVSYFLLYEPASPLARRWRPAARSLAHAAEAP